MRGSYHAPAAKYKSTGDDAYRLLRAIMNTAVDDKRIGRSPCTVKGAGGTDSSKRPIATIADLQAAVDRRRPSRRLKTSAATLSRALGEPKQRRVLVHDLTR